MALHVRRQNINSENNVSALIEQVLHYPERMHQLLRYLVVNVTDIDEDSLEKAQEGIFPINNMKTYTHNYIPIRRDKVLFRLLYSTVRCSTFRSSLMKNIVFARHNLVTDQSFNEFNVIFCRNVMIYLDKTLKNRVHQLFHESLSMFGFLVLGDRESIHFSEYEDSYKTIDLSEKLYQKMK